MSASTLKPHMYDKLSREMLFCTIYTKCLVFMTKLDLIAHAINESYPSQFTSLPPFTFTLSHQEREPHHDDL